MIELGNGKWRITTDYYQYIISERTKPNEKRGFIGGSYREKFFFPRLEQVFNFFLEKMEREAVEGMDSFAALMKEHQKTRAAIKEATKKIDSLPRLKARQV